MKHTLTQYAIISATALMFGLAHAEVPAISKPYEPSPAEVDEPLSGEEVATLTTPPNVPPPINRKHPSKVKVELEVMEVTKKLSDGVEYTFWTFGGSVPGKMIRVRQNDMVDFTLKNHPSSKMPHNIDLHAVTGPGGGAKATFTAPGHATSFSFKAINPGLFIYHCATAPVGMHIGNGMYGLILVEPKEGMAPVDKEFYVCQGDFYTTGRFGQAGLQGFSMEKAIDERPDYVVFNGSVGSLTGDNALKAEQGQRVRLYVGNGGPNLISSFHVIGEIFDRVYTEGGEKYSENVQTTLVPAGGSAICEFKLETIGTYILVDHSIFRTFNKGALGMLTVTGKDDKEIYSGQKNDIVYLPEGSHIQTIASETKLSAPADNKAERMIRGKTIFEHTCMACHQANGQGIPAAFPPLAGSDFLNADKNRAIKIVLKGLQGEVVVNGAKFNSIMPSLGMNDEDVANVLTYVYNTWDNKGHEVIPSEVKAQRDAK